MQGDTLGSDCCLDPVRSEFLSRWASTIPGVDYQALYRKYRPQRFEQVIGQDHVTHILSKEIAEGRVAHAYLFAGPRGTGKTTTARLLAKSLNCPDREMGSEACGICASCTAVAASSSLDVMELDAASHNKVEDIRDIRASVSTVASVGGAKRVFILDEAHMLTKSASNALLKTLEEPPDHVHFVLATTEPYRLLDTIRSRSQRFDFQLVPADLIAGLLEQVCNAEGYRASTEALVAVARRAGGSVRDALSLLEQVAALDGSVTRKGIRNALGVAGPEALLLLVEALAEADAKAALELVAGLAARGVDLRRFAGGRPGVLPGGVPHHVQLQRRGPYRRAGRSGGRLAGGVRTARPGNRDEGDRPAGRGAGEAEGGS